LIDTEGFNWDPNEHNSDVLQF